MRGAIPVAVLSVCLSLLSWPAQGQPRVSPRQMYERLMVVVPLVGAGTVQDPKRPMFAPGPNSINAASRTGIIAFTYVLSDDGKFALTEFVARDQAAFKGILTAPALATSKIFTKGVHTQADVETEFKKYKKDFDFNKFGVHIQ